jgi:hypothetical protein
VTVVSAFCSVLVYLYQFRVVSSEPIFRNSVFAENAKRCKFKGTNFNNDFFIDVQSGSDAVM